MRVETSKTEDQEPVRLALKTFKGGKAIFQIAHRHGLVLPAALAVMLSTAAMAMGVRVDQITDPSATAATGMFFFEPNFVEIAPGEEITFLNSRADHTVTSIKGLWNEDTPTVSIGGKPSATVRFDHPGIYGITCRRHGRYGMAMFVKVGEPDDIDGVRQAVEDAPRLPKRAKATLMRLVEEHLE